MPTGIYPRTAAHNAAISAAQRRRLAQSPSAKKRACENLVHDKASPRWRPANRQANSSAKKAWWASLADEDRSRFLSKRGAGIRKYLDSLTPEQRRERFASFTRAGAAATKQMWAKLTPEEKAEKLAPIWIASQNANPSSIEDTVARLLDALGVKYQRQVFIGRCLVDFWLREKKLVIECDGTYWHTLPGRPQQDAARDAWLQSRGFAVLRLPEPLIRSGEVASTLAEIAS